MFPRGCILFFPSILLYHESASKRLQDVKFPYHLWSRFFSSKIFRVFPQLFCNRGGVASSWDGENCFSWFTGSFSWLVLSLVSLARVWGVCASSENSWTVVVCAAVSLCLSFQKHLRFEFLTILWFREKGGIGFAICINFICFIF